MAKLLHRKQKYSKLGFIPIHTKVQQQQEIHRPCSQYIIELGFCRYRFVEYSYSIESNRAAFPRTIIVLRCTDHICKNNNNDSPKFRMNYMQQRTDSKIILNRLITLQAKNNNLLCNNGRHTVKPILMEPL
jgi:hypothetical protein